MYSGMQTMLMSYILKIDHHLSTTAVVDVQTTLETFALRRLRVDAIHGT